MNNSIKNNILSNLKSTSIDWDLVQLEMKNKLGLDIYESWLKKISFLEEFNNYLLLSVPTRFIRDWITSRYLDQILQIIKNHKKDIIRIEFKIVEVKNNDGVKELSNILPNNHENISFIKDTFLQYNRIDPNKRFENFITGSSNNGFVLRYWCQKINQTITHSIFMVGRMAHLLNSIGFQLKKKHSYVYFCRAIYVPIC